MSVDNTRLVSAFVPEVYDGDTFLYTELLDRSKKSGNNKGRIVKSFFHRSRSEFLEQSIQIKHLCEAAGVRAYTRLSPRSFRSVGMTFTKIVVEQSLTGNWEGMRHAYYKACGTTTPSTKTWLFDVDLIWPSELPTAAAQQALAATVASRAEYLACIPSRKGFHLITRPFNVGDLSWQGQPVDLEKAGISLHKDNPTNLYIPESAV